VVRSFVAFASASVILVSVAPAASAAQVRFSPPEQFTAGVGAWMVRTADLNSDGKPDLVVANAGSVGPGGVSILMNTTPKDAPVASFRTCPALTTAGVSAQALAVADLTGDGKPDVIVGNFFTSGNFPTAAGVPLGPGVQVFVNTTPAGAACPTFAAPIEIPAGTAPEVLAVGDFNGDGRLDLAFTDYGIPGFPQTQDVSVVMNAGVHDGQLRFGRRYSWHVGEQPLGVAVADVNGDGEQDLVVGSNFSYEVSVLMNHSANGSMVPSFSAPVNFPAGSVPIGPETLAVGDLTGNGKPDIVTPNFTSAHGMSVLTNETAPGASVPSFAPAVNYDPGLGPQMIALADFTGDGRNDIAVAMQGTVSAGNLAVLAPGGALGVLSPLGSLPYLGNVTGGTSSGVEIYQNNTPAGARAPVFEPVVHFAAGNGSDALAVADFNGDGRPDLAIANNLSLGPAGVSVLMNRTPSPALQAVQPRRHYRPALHRSARRHHSHRHHGRRAHR
jgi:hypothetical protein